MKSDLDLDGLIKEVNALEDYERASAALAEVAHRAPALGADLAMRVLDEARGDAHLRAFAFNILHSYDRARALRYAHEHMLSAEPLVFAAMLTEAAEDVGLLGESDEIRGVVAALSDALQRRPKDELATIQKSAEFFAKTYAINLPS